MKLENTPENKMKFFALYWGQKVMKEDGKHGINTYKVGYLDDGFEDHWLELTPLSQITDEDAIEVGRILGYKIAWEAFHFGKDICLSYTTAFTERAEIVIEVTDFLRSRGYYVGDGTEIEYGWVKLKTT